MTLVFYLANILKGGSLKRYNAVNNKWLLFGLVIPILLFFLSYNAVFAYFTATAGEKQASTQTAIVKIGFKADENGNYATHEVISSSATNNASNLVPGDTLKANATVINTGNVNVYCIINFKLSVTKKSSTDEEIIANDFYTFTSAGGQLVTPLTLKDTYTTEAACLIAPNAEVKLNVQTKFDGSTYGNDYVGADVKYTYTAYAIQTSGLTPASAISEILTSLLNGGNRITKIGGNSVQNGTPTPESPVEIQSVGEKTKNLVNIKNQPSNITSCDYVVNDNTLTLSPKGDVLTKLTYKINLKQNTDYVLSGSFEMINVSDYVGQSSIFVRETETSGTLIKSTAFGKKTGEQAFTLKFNSGSFETAHIWLYYNQVNDGTQKNGTSYGIYRNLQLEEGSTATEYEPYGYKIPVKTSGKNLINVENSELDKYINNSGIVSSAAYGLSVTEPIYLEPNTDYTYSGMGNVQGTTVGRVGYRYNADGSAIEALAPSYGKAVTFNSGTTTYIRLLYVTTNGQPQLEKASSATIYEPYFENITNIYLDEPLRKVGDYADYIDVQNGKVVRNVRNIKLNVSDMDNSETFPGWKNVSNISSDLGAGIDIQIFTVTDVSSNICLPGQIRTNTKGGSTLYFIESTFNINQTQWKETYPDLVFDLNYGLPISYAEDIELPEIFDEPITEYSILTTIQPDITVKYLVK